MANYMGIPSIHQRNMSTHGSSEEKHKQDKTPPQQPQCILLHFSD